MTHDEFWLRYTALNEQYRPTLQFSLRDTGLFSELRLLANAMWLGVVTQRRCQITDHLWLSGPDQGWGGIFDAPIPLIKTSQLTTKRAGAQDAPDVSNVQISNSSVLGKTRKHLELYGGGRALVSLARQAKQLSKRIAHTIATQPIIKTDHFNEYNVFLLTNQSDAFLPRRNRGLFLGLQNPTNAQGVALIFSMLMQPNAEIRAQMDKGLSGIDTTEPFVAVHLRAGDKLNNEAKPIHDLAVFAEPVRQSGLKRVLVASDDHRCALALKSQLKGFDVTLLSRETDRGYEQTSMWEKNSVGRTAAIVDALIAFEVMTKAAVLVGTGSSNVGRMAAVMRQDQGVLDVECPRDAITKQMCASLRSEHPTQGTSQFDS